MKQVWAFFLLLFVWPLSPTHAMGSRPSQIQVTPPGLPNYGGKGPVNPLNPLLPQQVLPAQPVVAPAPANNPAPPEPSAQNSPPSTGWNSQQTTNNYAPEESRLSSSRIASTSLETTSAPSAKPSFSEEDILAATTSDAAFEAKPMNQDSIPTEQQIQVGALAGTKAESGAAENQITSNGTTGYTKRTTPSLAKAALLDPAAQENKAATPTSPTEETWLAYNASNTKSSLARKLSGNPKFREELSRRVDELLQSRKLASQDRELAMQVKKAIADSKASEANSLENLQPLSAHETFFLGNEDTKESVSQMIAEFEASDPQFLPENSLFERVSSAHKRSLEKHNL